MPLLGPSAAVAVIAEFRLLTDEIDVLEHFDRAGVDAATAITACRLWGRGAIKKLEENPYCLNLLQPWRVVDARAERLGVGPDDSRRLLAAIGEVISQRYGSRGRGAGGHTAATKQELTSSVERLLGSGSAATASKAFDLARASGEIIPIGDAWQGRAPSMMERKIESEINSRVVALPSESTPFRAAITEVEAELGIRLDHAQESAIRIASTHRFAVIDGAAGTGKSLVTRAVMRAVQLKERSYTQIALSGRAAKRLREATGHEALTVHRFLKEIANGKREIKPGTLLIDEASMISTADLWQILNWVSADTDLVLVGDPGQLPPIGAGNPLTAIVAQDHLPRATLEIIHRQSGASPIPVVARELRRGAIPSLPAFRPDDATAEGVFLLPCTTAEVPTKVLGAFEAFVGPPASRPDREAIRRLHAARVQVLGMTIHGPAGVRTISESIEARWLAAQPAIAGWGLAEGSKILWTKNSYDHPSGAVSDTDPVKVDIMNGTLGIVQRPSQVGASVLFDDERATKADIRATDLDRISRGWAVTVHKAQGSAFERVIIPVVPSRLLDRQMLYTAITRAKKTVVLVGDPEVLNAAVKRPPRAMLRRQCLFGHSGSETAAA
ncbi:AAA family ATPase [Tsuneonella deserti]|uniref:AAA family ATPase n=1 Tax=Tsuneonella deserti TaxID=2035528 RepID=UPI001E33081E|nr:AAA family ATPase [Tsuneonella deserti]